jgi:hypothetical protein
VIRYRPIYSEDASEYNLKELDLNKSLKIVKCTNPNKKLMEIDSRGPADY